MTSAAGGAASPAGHPIRRLLFMQLKWMGDVLLCTPAVRAVRRAFPDARLDFMTGAEGAAVLAGNPHLDRVIPWQRGLRTALRLEWAVARAGYDAVVDFRSTPRDALLVLASRAPLRIGLRGRGPRSTVYTHLFPKQTGVVYMPRQKLELLRPLGIDPEEQDLALELVVGDDERAFAARMLQRVGLAGDAPIVAISAVSRVHYKQWAPEKWAAIADRVTETGARVLLTSGPGELEQARAVAERMRHQAVWDYGGCSIRQLAAVYQRCALWLGNDGGAKHIAAAVGTPTFTVFRYRESGTWTDLRPGSGHGAVEHEPVLACIYPHCGDCPHLSCLVELGVDHVAPLLDQALARALARRVERTGPGPGPRPGPEDPAGAGSRAFGEDPAAAASPSGSDSDSDSGPPSDSDSDSDSGPEPHSASGSGSVTGSVSISHSA